MIPHLHENEERERIVPYAFVGDAMDTPDPATLFRVVVRMLQYSVDKLGEGKDAAGIQQKMKSALQSANTAYVSSNRQSTSTV